MGLETIVRPISSKDFRPTARPLIESSDDNPTTIDGGTGQLIALNHSANYSWSHNIEREYERTYDVMRIHNPNDDSQFVDDEVITEMRRANFDGSITKVKYGHPTAEDNIEILDSGRKRSFDVAGFEVASSEVASPTGG